MRRFHKCIVAALLVTLGCFGGELQAQQRRQTRATGRAARRTTYPLTGVYRINTSESDKLYSVVAGASSNLPFGEQQRFFIDLAVRLTPPDLIAIEQRGNNITIGSSRAPRITLTGDGGARVERADDGRVVRTSTSLEGDRLVFTSSGRTEDNFSVIFAAADNGRRLRVTRRISAENLNQPVIIQTIYDKIADNARWDIYGETLLAKNDDDTTTPLPERPLPARAESVRVRAGDENADVLRAALNEWIEATNSRDISRQMDFYMPSLRAFYLARNVTRAFVRKEKARAFTTADSIDIKIEEPEIIFLDSNSTAIMRFRKNYDIRDGSRSRSGAVIQELRWQRTGSGWRIFSERDIRVLR